MLERDAVYVLFDERASAGNPDDATILCTANELHEAYTLSKAFPACAIYKGLIDRRTRTITRTEWIANSTQQFGWKTGREA